MPPTEACQTDNHRFRSCPHFLLLRFYLIPVEGNFADEMSCFIRVLLFDQYFIFFGGIRLYAKTSCHCPGCSQACAAGKVTDFRRIPDMIGGQDVPHPGKVRQGKTRKIRSLNNPICITLLPRSADSMAEPAVFPPYPLPCRKTIRVLYGRCRIPEVPLNNSGNK